MGVFNRTFYDLNRERHYCFSAAEAAIPSALIADIKISVPNYTDEPAVSGIFIKAETVKITVAAAGKILLSYSSESRSMLRPGRTYPMKSREQGYEGIIVFGDLKTDIDYKGVCPVSEECLTRFQPSAITYVSVPCTNIRLSGEVFIGGDDVQTKSSTETIPDEMFGIDRSVIIDLTDTGVNDKTNPMILFANGVNAFNDAERLRSPVYTIGGIGPDEEGTVFVRFENHFRIAAVVEDILDDTEETPVAEIAVGTDSDQDYVCRRAAKELPDDPSQDCPIELITIDYA